MKTNDFPTITETIIAANECLTAHTRPTVTVQRAILANLVHIAENCLLKHSRPTGGRKPGATPPQTVQERVAKHRAKNKSKKSDLALVTKTEL